ncbi:MAG: ribonuclease PH [Pirellulales bacterium]|nr:ribonuclease PH [Pirellulales bacterium]
MRTDHRGPDEIRPLAIQRHFTGASPGSVLIQAGRTTVLCTASVDLAVPPWMTAQNRGWVTAEYSMLPGSTRPRKPRERAGKADGRTSEIQRLIGRSLRAVTDLAALGPRTITLDCDVLEADGGTRTLSITGALVALIDALASIRSELPGSSKYPIRDSVAAVSVGMIDEFPLLDLSYEEDSAAKVDMNVVMTGNGRFVEIQGTGEESTFSDEQLQAMLSLARGGIRRLTQVQRDALGTDWPFAD